MDGLALLSLKANNGKVYQFSATELDSPATPPLRFDTLQLARLHIDRFTRLKADETIDLLSVLGLHDRPAEIQARAAGPQGLYQAHEALAHALFHHTLWVYDMPMAEPVVLPQPTSIENIMGIDTSIIDPPINEQDVDDLATEAESDNLEALPTMASPDEMAYCRGVVSMATGEVILTLTDIHLTGSASLQWQRCYRSSLSHQNVGLGYGWRSNFHFELTPIARADDGVTQWYFIDHQGSVLVFDDVAEGGISYQLTAGASLTRDAHGCYRVTLRGGRQLRFGYQHSRWVLERLRENETLQYQLSYSSGGRLVHIAANDCQQLELRYDQGGNLIEVQSPTNEDYVSRRGPQRVQDTEQVLAHYHYNADRDLSKASNRQQQVETYHYHDHLLVQRIHPSGFSHTFEWRGLGPGAQCCVQSDGDEGNNAHLDFNNHVTVSTDSLGNQWRFEHNAQRRLLCKISPLGHRWQFQYDAYSRKSADIAPDGAVTYYRYNRFGQLHEEQAPDGAITRYRYNRLGLIILMVDGENREWRNDYNSFGRLLSQHFPGGLEKHYQYDRRGRLSHITQSDGQYQRYWWTSKGQVAAIQQGEAVTRYSYDSLSEINGMISHDGWVTQYRRERSGLIVEIIQHPQSKPDQRRHHYIEYDWCGRPTAFTDALNCCNTVVYQGIAQPIKYIYPDGNWLAFNYDSECNLTGIERSDDARYQLAYDGENRVIQTTGFDGRIQQYQYNGHGLLVTLSDQAKRFIQLRRDECGRVIEQRSSVEGIHQTNYFQFDKLGRLRHANCAQRKISFHYHANGQQAEVWQDDWRVQYHYDSAGRRISTKLPNNHQIQYRYNGQGMLIAIEWEQLLVCTREFDDCGREIQRVLGNGITYQQHFDVQGRLKRQRRTHPQSPEQIQHYHYSLIDQLVGISVSEQGKNPAHYDVLEPLIDGRSCSIDTTACVSHEPLLQWHDTYYRYDSFGNQVKMHCSQGNEQRQFNGLNQLISIKTREAYTQYHYDALGRRSAKISESLRVDYLWEGDQLIGEHSNGQWRWYVYEPDSIKPIALIEDGEVYYYQLDHSGTPIALTDQYGDIVWQADYTPEGIACLCIEQISNPLRFQGQYYDAESGLYYNRGRYYDPQIGRFIDQPPVILQAGMDLCHHSPNANIPPEPWSKSFGLSGKKDTKTGDEVVQYPLILASIPQLPQDAGVNVRYPMSKIT